MTSTFRGMNTFLFTKAASDHTLDGTYSTKCYSICMSRNGLRLSCTWLFLFSLSKPHCSHYINNNNHNKSNEDFEYRPTRLGFHRATSFTLLEENDNGSGIFRNKRTPGKFPHPPKKKRRIFPSAVIHRCGTRMKAQTDQRINRTSNPLM